MKDIAERRWADAIGRLRGVVRRRGVPDADADDVVQRALENALRRLDTLENQDRFDAWTNQIAANAALDEVRRTARAPVRTELDVDLLPSPIAEATDPFLSFAECVHPMLRQLPRKDAELLERKDLEGRTFASLVADYGLSIPGLKSRVQRARRHLAAQMVACCAVLRDHEQALEAIDHCHGGCCADAPSTSRSNGQPHVGPNDNPG